MSLSKPVWDVIGKYFEHLSTNPIKTKSVTACILAISANIVSQKLISNKNIDVRSLAAFGIFALLFGGTIPHYFYFIIEHSLNKNIRLRKYIIFLLERLILTPTMTMISLCFLTKFEDLNHKISIKIIKNIFKKILFANWFYLSLPSFLNIYFIPRILRVPTSNIISFFWIIYVSKTR